MMNEKIKELAKQAYGNSILSEGDLEFAELIIRECAEFIGGEYGYSEGEALLEHFGVEE